MKKLVVLALSLLASLSTFAGPQGDDNGFGLKFFAGLHGDKYGRVDGGTYSKDYPNASPTLGFAIDNRWYVANPGKVGIAINARWFDFSYARVKHKLAQYTSKTKFFDTNFLGIGAIGTYYLDDKSCVDLYYNIMPNMLVVATENDVNDDSSCSFGFGASHRVGAAYRFKVFQAGFEIKGGKLAYQDWGDDVSELMVGKKIRTGSFRIFLGFKF